MKGYGPESFGEFNADRYDTYFGNPSPAETQAAVDVLAELAGADGTALEFAIGTGRVALPLAAKGVAVSGIEASAKMVQKLQAKPGGDAIPVTIGDMVDTAVDPAGAKKFDLVYLVFNTLFNVTTQEEQVRCFENAAAHLHRDGVFVIEAYVPAPERYERGGSLSTVHVDLGGAVFEAAVHDPTRQRVDYQYIEVSEDGTRMHPLPVRYAWPNELDLMAQLAGLELRRRWSGWSRAPFTKTSVNHVSVYGVRA